MDLGGRNRFAALSISKHCVCNLGHIVGKAKDRMPRRPPRPSAVQAAQNFATYMIAECETEDCILPKNGALPCLTDHIPRRSARGGRVTDGLASGRRARTGAFSPFHGFSKMLSEHADIRVGGSSVDGVSRAGLTKIVGTHFAEGMRKPSRNGNPGELESVAAHRLARHFLRARWRNPDDAEDMRVMEPFFRNLTPPQFHLCVSVLREFMQWRPGPAGRSRDRDAVSQQGGASKHRGDVVEAISVPDDELLEGLFEG